MHTSTTVILCGFTVDAKDVKEEVLKSVQVVAKDFKIPFVQIHSENTGLLWKTVIKNRVLLQLLPLDEIKEKYKKELKALQPDASDDDEPELEIEYVSKSGHVYYSEPKKKKKKCIVQ